MSDVTAALGQLGEVARQNPRDSVAWYRWAVGLARAGQRPAALQAVRNAMPHVVRAPIAVGMGKLFEILEQPAEALAAYRRATQLDPAHVEAQVCLAALLTRVGDPRAATLSLRAAIARAPQSAELEAELAEALLATGSHGEALEHARRAGELGMPAELAHSLLARIHEAQGKPDASLSELGQLSGFALEDANTLVGLARQLIASGDTTSALAALDRAAKAGPSDPALRLAIGEAMAAAGAAPQAVALLRQAVQLAPDSSAAHLALGRALRATGQIEESIGSLRTAVRLNPNDAQALATLGGILGQVGELEDSAHLLVRAASLAPDDEDIREALSRALASAPKRRSGSASVSAPPPSPKSSESPTMQAAPARPPANPAPSKRPGPAGGIVSDLSMFSLPELLEFLLNQRATGTLSLRSESLEAALELFEGQLSGARAPTGHRLVHALTEDGSVPNEQLWRALGEDPVGVTDLVVVNSVLNLQLYERKALTEKLGEHIKRSLLALVPLREGQAVFHRVPKGTTPPQPEIVIETRWALMEAVRLLDEETRDSSEADTAETPSLDPFEGI